MQTALLVASVLFVAFTNGANANFKGVASLYGTGTTTLRTALWWGTATTLAGSVAAWFFMEGLVKSFSGRGLVPEQFVESPAFLTSVAMGAALTSFLATRLGFPVSTTHALVGALLGAGLTVSGTDINLHALGKNFLYPLLVSPLLALLLGGLVYLVLRAIKLAPDQRSPGLDVYHFLSTGGASFARGLNDTPKIVALLVVAQGVNTHLGFAAVAACIALGGLLDAERVAETLGKKLTGMNPGQGFAASLVTAALVSTASLHSLPVSTTHVSVGALVGMGAVTGQAKWKKSLEVLAAWVITLPCAAVLAAAACLLIGR
ncbi:MAG: anion permease [Gemmataceae bacterium]